MITKGIDVSQYQGIIDWETTKQDIDYAILRVGYGQDQEDQDDKTFQRNVAECTRLNIPFGVYLYSYAKTNIQARGEANHVLRLIRGYKLDYPVYYDLEDERTTGQQSNEQIASIAKTFADILEKERYCVGIYSSYNWFMTKLTSPIFSLYTKWIARYSKELNYNGSVGMWQYTDDGRVRGIKGPVDLNECYVDFPSRMKQLGLNGYHQTYQIGDMVEFHHVFLTSMSTTPLKPYRTIGTITRIIPNAKNPYLIGKDQGWVNQQVIEAKVVYLANPDYVGNSIVDGLKEIGQDSSMANRTRIAILNGMDDYTGTEKQNQELLQLLKDGKLLSQGVTN